MTSVVQTSVPSPTITDAPADAAVGQVAPSDVWRAAAIVAGLLAVTVGVIFRFWTRSGLWLDEALTVNVARLSIGHIGTALRHDGAPPLYYYLLHGWMRVFGTSDVAVRAMGAVFSVASIPLVWLAGLRIGGRRTAWAAALFLATSPFAVRFATEARMYSLVMFLVLLGYLALDHILASARPGPYPLLALGLISGLLLLTHYWAIFLLVSVVGLLLGKALLVGTGRRGRYLWAAAAAAGGIILFLPWLPIFLYQNAHTGTPWADPPSFSAIVNAVSEFAGSRSSAGRALGLTFFALAGLGLMGTALDPRSIALDLRTRPAGRGVALVTVSTLLLAMAAGFVTHSAFAARYIAVVFPAFVLLVALGTKAFMDRRVLAIVVGAAVLFGLVSSTENVRARKTQAPQVAAVVRAGVRPGDVIAYCPDQLGPSVSRLLPAGLNQLTLPRLTSPQYVDWVDYALANKFDDPGSFAALLDRMAGRKHTLWFVWATGYRTYGATCETMARDLEAYRPGADQTVTADVAKYFERATLTRYPPAPAT